MTLAIAVAQGTGCSWISVTKPPPGPVEAAASIECTASPAAPIVDTIGSGLLGLGGVAALLGCAAFSGAKDSTGVCIGGAAAIGAAVALGFSAGYGYSVTADCRESQAKQKQLSCMSGVEASCREIQNIGAPCVSPADCLGGSSCKLNDAGRGYCVGTGPASPGGGEGTSTR